MTSEDAIKKIGLYYVPVSYRRVLTLLGQQDSTTKEIAAHLGRNAKAAVRIVGFLKQKGVVCVTQHCLTPSGNRFVRYGIGSTDVPAPPKMTNSERCKRWEDKRKIREGKVKLGMFGI